MTSNLFFSLQYTYKYPDKSQKSFTLQGTEEAITDVGDSFVQDIEDIKDFYTELKILDPNGVIIYDYLEPKDPTP